MEKHLHRYVRSRTRKDIYRCVHPDCTHYNRAELIIGKRAECSKCGAEMIIEESQAIKYKTKYLTCLNCSKSKKAQEYKITRDKIRDILIESGINLDAKPSQEGAKP